MERTAESTWTGSGKEGKGKLSTQTGAMKDQPYSFSARFEENGKPGTNPEELIGAAHAGCFNMALAVALGKENITPDELHTKATVSLTKTEGGFSINKINLNLTAKIPGIEDEKFQEIARGAKQNCPVSKLLTGAEITLDARLKS